MNNDLSHRSFWQVYTPRNIYFEMKARLSRLIARKTKPMLAFSGIAAKGAEEKTTYQPTQSQEVGKFYDTYHEKFIKVYGPVIQAFRTKDVDKMLDYLMQSIGFSAGQKVLDAGCGVGAPAIYFARHYDIHIDAITLSKKQYEAALQNISAKNLADKIHVVQGDYHSLPDYFHPGTYDVIYFLESFGHSTAKEYLLEVCWEMLKPGGVLYLKDLFQRIPMQLAHKEKIDHEIRKINAAYCYEVANLNTVLNHLRRKGFILASLKTIDIKLEEFENLTISNEFQELTGIALIDNWDEYIFPVDFFELKCIKPTFDLDKGEDRYFLQNLYYMQVEGWNKNQL